ncbi:hypothetical protein [Butyrivibrio sp.]|uniref:hypothetical protein n=1 Tax=Butyrivibrio sp. TaxID=28121 RepID=UPI0025B7B638|nr:hypothetical protein [Butyrivibrio sp.]MBQ7430224.1 hypothetical protein [Butyrivibrio sp.]MBQ9303398.1 hypothetical protein [Butyrivibrio sp.]
MKNRDVIDLVSYRTEFPKDSALDIFNRWQAIQPSNLKENDLPEALFVSGLIPNEKFAKYLLFSH